MPTHGSTSSSSESTDGARDETEGADVKAGPICRRTKEDETAAARPWDGLKLSGQPSLGVRSRKRSSSAARPPAMSGKMGSSQLVTLFDSRASSLTLARDLNGVFKLDPDAFVEPTTVDGRRRRLRRVNVERAAELWPVLDSGELQARGRRGVSTLQDADGSKGRTRTRKIAERLTIGRLLASSVRESVTPRTRQ